MTTKKLELTVRKWLFYQMVSIIGSVLLAQSVKGLVSYHRLIALPGVIIGGFLLASSCLCLLKKRKSLFE